MSREEGHGSDDSKGDPNPQIPKTNSHKELKISKTKRETRLPPQGPPRKFMKKKKRKEKKLRSGEDHWRSKKY